MEWWFFIRRYFILRKMMAGCKPLILALFATFSLLGAYWAEYKFHIPPCQLCWYQRYILIALIGVSLLSALWRIIYPFARVVLWVSFFFNSYQIGVEQKWWRPPTSCGRSIEGNLNTPEDKTKAIYESLHTQTMPSCDQIGWRIYQIPATVWFEGALAIMLLWTRR